MKNHCGKSLLVPVLTACLCAAAVVSGCSEIENPGTGNGGENTENPLPEPPRNPYDEPVPETVVFTNASLVYKGDDGFTGISDEWALTLWTDGYPLGPSKVMRLDVNSTYNSAQTVDMDCLLGNYSEQTSTGDFSEGTFNWGQLARVELPSGIAYLPDMSYYGDVPDGETEFDPDLLREGKFTISLNPDGTYTVEGILVGTYYTKRYFTYTGPLEAKAEVDPAQANTTLKSDLALGNIFSKARVYDRGNRYFLPDPSTDDSGLPNAKSYRYIEFYLAESGIDLDVLVPAGTGRILQIDFLVPYDWSAADGIPAGKYTVTHRIGSGVDREDIVPFRFVEGQADMFSHPAGTWYRTMAGGEVWGDEYARITDGTVTVERPDGKHRIIVDVLDCASPAHRITGTIDFGGTVEVFE